MLFSSKITIKWYPFGMLAQNYNAKSYRFGFNTQERTDEISGTGNHNTALFWEYNTRLGRRWNLDPKPQVFISDYAVLGNNPLSNIDVLGDTIKILNNQGDLLLQINNSGETRFFKVTNNEKFNEFQVKVIDEAKKGSLLKNVADLIENENSGVIEMKIYGDFSDAYSEPEKNFAKEGYEDGFSGKDKNKVSWIIIGIKEESKCYIAYGISYERGQQDRKVLILKSLANKQKPVLTLTDGEIIVKKQNYYVKYKKKSDKSWERLYFVGYPPKEKSIPKGSIPR